jgi:CBS domain-containing membrane protein
MRRLAFGTTLASIRRMLKISDIMTDDVFTVAATAPVSDVAWALAIRNISGAPVRDARGRLIGTVTKAELCDPERGVWSWDDRQPVLAEDVMSPRVLVARADQPAAEAVALLARERLGQIVVIDGDGGVVGIITPMDVMKALVHGDRFVEERPEPELPDEAWETYATAS